MSELRVEDSGNYSCGIYYLDIPLIEVIRTISLQVSPGSQGQGPEEVNLQEGQTLMLRCRYNPQIRERSWKMWCKWRENRRWCDDLIISNSVIIREHQDPRDSLQDDPNTGIMIITMSELRVKDSGSYSCGIYDSVRNTIEVIRRISLQISPAPTFRTIKHSQTTTETPVTTSATPLVTSRPSHSSIFASSPVIQVLCGLIVTKGLIFTALVVLLRKGTSHCELSQNQNGLG
ncbi:trem-like transcript 4 protein isoform X5 [Dromiciops gliroides]|uniref:trem-like transcript 4 protein isoform X5 n=1 Tax=Dromiciops gliroides TaxID=33562 RepID=UPI001CC3D53C|nr:trem-like transcript 4 protein isoform X5 [Dromiciops gliroides]